METTFYRASICSEMPSEGRPLLGVPLDTAMGGALRALARAKGEPVAVLIRAVLMEHARRVIYTLNRVSQLVRMILMDFMQEDASCRVDSNQKEVEYTLDRIKALVDTFQTQMYGVGIAGIATQRQQEEL